MNISTQTTACNRGNTSDASIPEQRIRERAYEIYVQRGRKGGHAEGDWLTAEAELKELKTKAASMVSAIESLTERGVSK
jgi:Protein of unknown function (DUF2934)